jgi:hypothetical protein
VRNLNLEQCQYYARDKIDKIDANISALLAYEIEFTVIA